jgi:tetratricopeptide (TPR) repeat protein
MSREKDNNNKAEWREIMRLYGRGMTASTALLAQRYVAHHPKRAIAWLYHGASLGQMSRYPEAISALRRAARLFPPAQRALVYFHFGQLYERKGVVRLAEPWYRRAIASCPSDAGYRIILGRVLHRAGRLKEAAAVLRRATRCKEGCCEEAFLHLGYALVGLQRFSEARRCFRHALDIDTKYTEARRALSDIEYVIQQNRNA